MTFGTDVSTDSDPSDSAGSASTGGESTGDATTGATTGTGTSGDDETETDPWPDGPALYPSDRTLSPITRHVADNLRSVAAAEPDLSDEVFAKVGASATVSAHFMQCFDGEDIEFEGHDELWVTIEQFAAEAAAGVSSYARESLAATVGWPAFKVLQGDPSPLEQEVEAIAPRYAVVMFGTNDIGWSDLHGYADDMLTLSDLLIDRGTIPLLTTIMPRDDAPSADAMVPRYNAVVRAVAQARQIPLIDYHRELAPLPDHGLGGDGIHPSVHTPGGIPKSCVFTDEGLTHGYTLRNWLTISTLDRLRRVVGEGVESLDAAAPELTLAGEGSRADPFVVPEFPFTDLRDTTSDGSSELDIYSGCGADQDESGREVLYLLEIPEPMTLWFGVFDRGDVDIDLHLLDETADEAGCIARDDREIVRALDPGTYYLSLDTYIAPGVETAGEYLLAIIREDA